MIGLIALVLTQAPALVDAALQAASAPPAPSAPQTPLGRAVEVILMALRYAFFVVPAAIVATELWRERRARPQRRDGTCERCGLVDDAPDAAYCRQCGSRLGREAGMRS